MPDPMLRLNGDNATDYGVDVKSKKSNGKVTNTVLGTTKFDSGNSLDAGYGASGGGALTPGMAVGASKQTKAELFGTIDNRYSSSQIDMIREKFAGGKAGRPTPAAALLSPYQGYGGPRGTAVGNSNTQTATKMLLGV